MNDIQSIQAGNSYVILACDVSGTDVHLWVGAQDTYTIFPDSYSLDVYITDSGFVGGASFKGTIEFPFAIPINLMQSYDQVCVCVCPYPFSHLLTFSPTRTP